VTLYGMVGCESVVVRFVVVLHTGGHGFTKHDLPGPRCRSAMDTPDMARVPGMLGSLEGTTGISVLPEDMPGISKLPEGTPGMLELPEDMPGMSKLPEGMPGMSELSDDMPAILELPEGMPGMSELLLPGTFELSEGTPGISATALTAFFSGFGGRVSSETAGRGI